MKVAVVAKFPMHERYHKVFAQLTSEGHSVEAINLPDLFIA